MKSTPADEQKFLDLVDLNRQKILRICRVYSWNPAEQEDLYQEILVQIWRGMLALKEPQFAHTWLYRVAINTAISFVRKRTAGSRRIIPLAHGELTRTIESQQQVEGNDEDRVVQLYTAIYKLNPLEKALVTLFLEDFSYEEIAEATGISANHVGVMLHRAKKKISSLMKEAKCTTTS
ncbi:MAG: RNA polymerase sigma factor [Verrucomicrobiota bacterium]